MISTQQAVADMKWLRAHAKKHGLAPYQLLPHLQNANQSILQKWIAAPDDAMIVPRKRSHTSSIAAYRARVENKGAKNA